MSAKMKCRIITFEETYELSRRLANKVKDSDYSPTTIVALARGGWVPARLLCDFMGITDLISLKVEHWLETAKTKDEATIRYPLNNDLKGKRLLLVDDVADTGKSLIAATNYLSKLNPDSMKTATMQYFPSSKFTPDFYTDEVKEWTWFIYPWNWIEDTSTLIIRLMETDKEKAWSSLQLNDELRNLFEIEWDETMLRHILQTMLERNQIVDTEEGFRIRDTRVIRL